MKPSLAPFSALHLGIGLQAQGKGRSRDSIMNDVRSEMGRTGRLARFFSGVWRHIGKYH